MRNSLRRISVALLLAGFLTIGGASTPIFAQEAAQQAAQKAGSAEMPREEKPGAEKPSLEGWKWANFAILVAVLGWFISKNVGPMLAARSKEIHEGLAAGERAKAEADARAAAVASKLSGLGQAVSTMQAEARTEREQEGARIQREAAAEMARIQQNAAFEVESASKLARLSVQRQAAKSAIELAEQKVRARMSPEMQAALAQNFIGELSSASVNSGKLS